MSLNNQNTVGGIYLLPFFIFFTVTFVALLQPGYGSQIQLNSSIVNQVSLSLAYLLGFILLLKQQGFLSWVLSKSIPLDLLFFLMLISLFWSDYPGKVVISFIHNTGASLIALCMAIMLVNNKDKFFKFLLITLFVYIVATIAVTLIRPDIGLMKPSNIYDRSIIGRWRGLTTHPNSLGAICLFTTWVGLSTFFFSKKKIWVSLLALLTLVGAFYCLYKSNSMTSTLISVALVFGMTWFFFIGNSVGEIKFVKIAIGLLILFVGVMLIYILHPELISEKYFFRAIGRDASLTGRTSLWEMGLKGFAVKPYFGWSYDSLGSFLKSNNLGYGQLHNGYLNLLVLGGLVSIFVFGALLIQLFSSLIKQAFIKNKDYVIIAALIVAVLVHNMTEASIGASTNIIWLLFLMAYFYCIALNYYRFSPIDASSIAPI